MLQVYVVGRSFKGVDPAVMEVLKAHVTADDIFKDRCVRGCVGEDRGGQGGMKGESNTGHVEDLLRPTSLQTTSSRTGMFICGGREGEGPGRGRG